MNLNAVGIDVSKRKSTVSVLRPGGDVLMKPFDISHRTADFQTLADKLKALDGETRVVMECTGHYYEPVARELSQAGLFVSAVNPQIINKFQGQGNPLRKVKTDKADSVKIARFIYYYIRWRKFSHKKDKFFSKRVSEGENMPKKGVFFSKKKGSAQPLRKCLKASNCNG